MNVTITLAPDEQRKLRDKAAAMGIDVETFVREAAMEKVARPSLMELLAPVHEATDRSGTTTEEIDRLAACARQEVREERRVIQGI